MNHSNLHPTLSSINSFEDFEKFKSQTTLLTQLATEIINLHNLPPAPLDYFCEGANIQQP
jgi:hypothetical protein